MNLRHQRGIYVESLFTTKVLELGHLVLAPIGNHWKFDMVIYNYKKFIKVQIKHADTKTNDTRIDIRRSGNNKYTADVVDFFALYDFHSGEWYIVPFSFLEGKCNVRPVTIQEYKQAWHLFNSFD